MPSPRILHRPPLAPPSSLDCAAGFDTEFQTAR
jgi:hypothetical protein